MTNLSLAFRIKIADIAKCILPRLVSTQSSHDGTKKLLLEFDDGAMVETVIIPSKDHNGHIRIAQCLSSQIGCPMGCTFCSTGAMGFIRNMTAGEILSQILIVKKYLGDNIPGKPILRNLVFMGMGEPLLNLREVSKAINIANNPYGLAFTPRKVTISTCGIKDGIEQLGDSELAYLAVSLHAPNQNIRARIMPLAAKWNLEDMMATLASYHLKSRERVTFEYLLLGGINDQPKHAYELAKLINRTLGSDRAKINLISYNPSIHPLLGLSTTPYRSPTDVDILQFEKILRDKGITAILRKSKGQDIKAACGQLATGFKDKVNR